MQRVAIIGASDLKGNGGGVDLEAFGWEEVSRVANLSDYHTVVIDLLSPVPVEAVDWEAFFGIANPARMLEVLRGGGRNNQGRIVVVGDPRFTVPLSNQSGPSGPNLVPFLSWTGMEFQWDDRPGRTKDCKFSDYRQREAYENYVSRLVEWAYSLVRVTAQGDTLVRTIATRTPPEVEVEVFLSPYCSSRYGTFLAGEAVLTVAQIGHHPHAALGSLVFLPSLNVPAAEARALLLKGLLGIDLATSEPSWVTRTVAPGQSEIDSDLRALEQEVAALRARITERQAAKTAARQRLRLLYGQHADLEDAVRAVLRDLGAEVLLPKASNKEDGWIRVRVGDDVLEGVLEIKGTAKDQFDERGLRQLSEWVQNGLDKGKTYKGIFVGNASATKPPAKRPNPFRGNFATRGAHQRFTVINSVGLLAAYEALVDGRLNRDTFWQRLFATDGVFDASEIITTAEPS